MVHLGWLEGRIRRAVTGFTGTTGRNVGCRLAQRVDAVVAIRTDFALDVGRRMAEGHRSPGHIARAVTAFAGSRCLDMLRWLGQRILGNEGSAVTGRTGLTGRGRMTHGRRLEGGKVVMTTIALGRRRNMGNLLAHSRRTMAGIALADGRRFMAVFDQSPGTGAAVTGIALLRRAHVRQRLGQCILRNIGTTVAVRALSPKTTMVHHGRRPGSKTAGMAGIALRNCRNMADRLGLRVGRQGVIAVVTGRTFTGRTGVIH